MNKDQYREYLRSPRWKATRARILQRANGRCERSGIFCGPSPHPWKDGPCYEDDCAFCTAYFTTQGLRNEDQLRGLDVHHVTYERVGHERDEDLLALCESCHDHFTDRTIDLKSVTGLSTNEALRLAHSPAARHAYFTRSWERIKARIGFVGDLVRSIPKGPSEHDDD